MARIEPKLHDQTNILTGAQLIVVFSALASAMLVTYTDQNSIGVALPTIGRELNCSSTVVWAGTSSLIANTAFQVLYGRLSDILGRKVILLTCLCLLGLGDLLCGFARSGAQLYAFRGISGLANGGIMALVMMVVSDVTTLEQRGKYQGILGSCVGLGNTVGPFVAAAFTKNATWRATFWFITPLPILVATLLYFLLPPSNVPAESLSTKLRNIDWFGGFFVSVGTILLLIPISGLGTQFRASQPMVIAMLTLGSILLFTFFLHEWRFARLPMFPLRFFHNPALAAMMIQNFLVGIVFFSLLYYLPIYFQSAHRLGPLSSAALITPLVILQAVASSSAGQYISRMGRYGEVIWLGYSLWLLGSGLHIMFNQDTSLAAIAVILGIEGFGVGLVFQPALVAAQAHSPKSDRAIVISARNFIRALGGSAGLAIASAIYSNTLVNKVLNSRDIPADIAQEIKTSIFQRPDISSLSKIQQTNVLNCYVAASRSVFYLWVGALGGCLALMILIKDRGLNREGKKETESQVVAGSESEGVLGENVANEKGERDQSGAKRTNNAATHAHENVDKAEF